MAGISPREAPALPHPPLHIFRTLSQMAVARIDVAPRVDDGDDRLARIVSLHAAHGRGPRPVPARTQIVRTKPAVTPQRFRILRRHRNPSARFGEENARSCAGKIRILTE